MTELPNSEEIVGEHFPLHGPYTRERTETAAQCVAEMVRYLNHATLNAPSEALPYASTVYSVVGSLNGAVGGLEQTCRQLADRVESMSINDPGLYSTHAGEAASDRAGQAVSTLEGAERAALALSAAFGASQEHLGVLGNHQPDEDAETAR